MITHPEKVLFPGDGITKGELAAYYEAVAAVMVPHIKSRPITMERFPAGIGRKGFIQKDVSKGFPSWLKRVEVPKKGGVVHHPIVTDARSLLWLANQNSITPHVWTSRAPDLYHPDICIFDLDPSKEDAGMLREAALALRDMLEALGLPSWVKTSGSKGFHIAVPLDRKAKTDVVGGFAHGVGAALVAQDPRLFTQEFHKVDRGDRVLVDTGRNGYSATFAAVVHLDRDRTWRDRAPDLHAAEHGRPARERRGSLGRHATAQAIADPPGTAAACAFVMSGRAVRNSCRGR